MDKNYLYNGAGYDLYEIEGEDNWAFHVKEGPVFMGTFKKVVTYMISRLGFDPSEIDYAVKTMVQEEHNAAHFGMYRGFIFSFSKEFKNVKDIKKVS